MCNLANHKTSSSGPSIITPPLNYSTHGSLICYTTIVVDVGLHPLYHAHKVVNNATSSRAIIGKVVFPVGLSFV